MRAMLLRRPNAPLEWADVPDPTPKDGQVLLRVECCAVCRTDLHVVDGELADPKLPLIPGHQIAGRDVNTGALLGVPWLGWTCGACRYCRSRRENLCDAARFTGYTLDGGYAEYALADERFCLPLPESYSPAEAAPLLCAGLIGYRAYRMACPERSRRGDAARIAFYGFGSAAQILAQIARADGRDVYAFTRDGDAAAQTFAREMGAVWAGGTSEKPPEEIEAAIVFAPSGSLIPIALEHVIKGGAVVCAGIHMTDIPSFPYSLLWGERTLRSVANLTRQDGVDFFERLKTLRIVTQRTVYPLSEANEALAALRTGQLTGTAVLDIIAQPRNRATAQPGGRS